MKIPRFLFAPLLFFAALLFCKAVNAQVEVDTYKLLKSGTLNVIQSGTGNVIVKSGTLTLSGTSPVSIPSGVVVNSGTMTLTGTSPVSIPSGVVVNSGTMTLTGSAETITPRTITSGTLTLGAATTRFEFLVSPEFVATYVTATGTTTVTGSGNVAYGVFSNRAAPGRTLGVSTITTTSGTGRGYDAQ